jgi:5-methylcytosine-specific restriction endonuclease McrA
MNQNNNKCLVLNSDYTALTIVDWKKAITWYFKYTNKNYGIEIIDYYNNDWIIGSYGRKYPVPAVARTKRYFRCTNQNVNFSRKNIFTRDNHTCQYCGKEKNIAELTYDHVVPKSLWDYDKGSPTSWTNIVTACIACNRKKGGRTPKQASMPVLNHPYKPTKNRKYLPITTHLSKIGMDQMPEEWKIYLE